MEDVEIIKDNEEILAIIIRKDFKAEGIKFFGSVENKRP